MERIPLGRLCYEFNRFDTPLLCVESGARLAVQSQDAFSGQIRTEADRRDKAAMPYSNPTTGPIFVVGAEKGDALAVTIHSIRPTRGECYTRTSDPKMLAEWLGTDCPHGTHVCRIADGVIHWSDTVKIPYRPMLGCIGTAPDWGVPTTNPAGPHGGNMDILEVAQGSTLFLPVYVPGALLYLGDAHAAMGHGELSASGLEMPAETEITVAVKKGWTIPGPRIESETELVCVSAATPLERGIAQAYAWLILWMERDYGWDRWKAYDLLTHAGQISVGYYSGGAVAVKIARRYL